MSRSIVLAGITSLLIALGPSTDQTGAAKLNFRLVAKIEGPTALTSHKSSPARLLVTERRGRIRVIEGGVLRRRPLLDIRSRIAADRVEQGLLGVAFSPDYGRSRRFYIMLTRHDGDLLVEEWRTLRRQPELADPSSRRELIRIPRVANTGNHNGGALRFFGSRLFITVGDGSNPGDIFNQAQDPNSLRGKILRIIPEADRSTGRPYRIPPDNPFISGAGRPEVFATGLRNPHSLHFHRRPSGSAEASIYDVGQFRYEEVNHLTLEALSGANFGWKAWEGFARYDCGDQLCPNSTASIPLDPVWPVHAYGRDQGCAVIGGPVVRDRALTGLTARLLFSDFCTGNFWKARPSTERLSPVRSLDIKLPVRGFPAVNAINEDAAGRIYVLSNRDEVYRLQASK